MMNSPEGYKKENENKTLEELVLERTTLFNGLVEYEMLNYNLDNYTRMSISYSLFETSL